jgi:glycosyltransferase involved in cell wall biosynthesis
MNILFFGPFNYRSRDNESLMLKFRDMGHNVFFLTTAAGDLIIPFLEENGIACFKTDITAGGKLGLLKNISKLAGFIRRHKIDLVFSHLETANFIAVLAQYLVRTRVVIVRHHSDLMRLTGADKALSYRLTYRLAREIIAVSGHARQFMMDEEHVAADKIFVINLAYNFDLFDKPVPAAVTKIRKGCKGLLVLTAGRLVPNKRINLSVNICKRANEESFGFNLIIVGAGPLEQELREQIMAGKLEDICTYAGFRKNIMDYLEACDILLHPSDSESSSVIIKEAGVRRKVIIACKGVGDCDEYIVNGENGYLLDVHNFEAEALEVIRELSNNEPLRRSIGDNLYNTIRERFDIENVIKDYQRFLK